MVDSIPTADLAQELAAPSPTVLDIYVVWHPRDHAGKEVFNELVTHYHSEHFSGLAGSAIEVFSRSLPLTPESAPPVPLRRATDKSVMGPTTQTFLTGARQPTPPLHSRSSFQSSAAT